MKTTSKLLAIFLTLGVLLAAAGGTVFAAMYPYGEGHEAALSENCKQSYDKSYSKSTEGVTLINISSAFDTEIINAGSGAIATDSVRVTAKGSIYQYPKRDNQFEVTKSDGRINIRFYPRPALFLIHGDLKITVILPAEYDGSLVIDQGAGDALLNVDNVFSDASVSVGSGSCEGSLRTRKDLNMNLYSGKLSGSFTSLAGKANVAVSSGRLDASVECEGDLNVQLLSGEIKGSFISSRGEARVTVSSGWFDAVVKCPGELRTVLHSGTMKGSFSTDKSAYINVSSGTFRAQVTAYHLISADLSSGTLVLTEGSGFQAATGKLIANTTSGNMELHLNRVTGGSVKVSSGSVKLFMPHRDDIAMSLTGTISSGQVKLNYATFSGTYNKNFNLTDGQGSVVSLTIQVLSGSFNLKEAVGV